MFPIPATTAKPGPDSVAGAPSNDVIILTVRPDGLTRHGICFRNEPVIIPLQDKIPGPGMRFLFASTRLSWWDPSMTPTWLKWLMPGNDPARASYDFAGAQPAWKSWWFFWPIAVAAIIIAGFFWPAR